jgi:hypothetical protein
MHTRGTMGCSGNAAGECTSIFLPCLLPNGSVELWQRDVGPVTFFSKVPWAWILPAVQDLGFQVLSEKISGGCCAGKPGWQAGNAQI